MDNAHIRFSTNILSRLGEELNPNADQGLIELVKNSYDADAVNCVIELHNTDDAGGSIKISDDGTGMSIADITNGWLVLGKSSKSRTKPTARGRIPAGNKGLGRLAALRLGKTVSVVTWPAEFPGHSYNLEIDWDRFSGATLVEDVPLSITEGVVPEAHPTGTQLAINGLRARLSRTDVKRLARSLVLLADPFGLDPNAFKPKLIAPEFSDMEALVNARYFSDAEFHLTATLDSAGNAHAEVTDWKGRTLYSAEHKDISAHREGRIYVAPIATFDLWVFLLSSDSFTGRTHTLGEVRNWLGAFGGVHLYENGLRVSPYGNAGNDWLDMNLRRAQSPEERPSTNTSIGRVAVSDISELLIQKTDRSGFIESEGFIELRSFAQDCLEWMAKRRLETANELRARARAEAPKRTAQTKVNIEEAIARTPPKVKVDIQHAFEAYERSRDREIQILQKEVQLYRTLSTAGITAATFAHESRGNPIKVITLNARTIERRGREALKTAYTAKLEKPVNSILEATKSLAVLGTATLKLIEWNKRRVGRVTIHDTIKRTIDMYEPFFAGRDVTVKLELSGGNPFLRGSEAAIESILTNLVNNSLNAFERGATRSRKLTVRTTIAGTGVVIAVLDNGPGIDGISVKDIWLPGQTTTPSGTGLGLTIVRDTVRDLGGTCNAKEHGELGGAEFLIELPILGA